MRNLIKRVQLALAMLYYNVRYFILWDAKRWFQGAFYPRYYTVRIVWDGKDIGLAMSQADKFGGCLACGVFDKWDDVYSYWNDRHLDSHDPGFNYVIATHSWNSPEGEDYRYYQGKK